MDVLPYLACYAAATQLAPKVLPVHLLQAYYMIRPSLTWAIAGKCLASGTPYLFCLLAVPHAAASVLAFFSTGSKMQLSRQLLYGPMLSSVLSWMFRSVPAVPTSMSASVVMLAVHLLQCILGAVLTMIYPAPIVGNLFDLSGARLQIAKEQRIRPFKIPFIRESSILLDAVVVFPSNAPSYLPKVGRRKLMIYCGGNGELFEGSFQTLLSMADKFGVTICMVNPMGVGESGGTTATVADLVDANKSLIEWMLHNTDSLLPPYCQYKLEGMEENCRSGAVSTRDIVAFGHSIGGGIASELVAHHYHDMSLVLDRTFSSLSDACVSLSPLGKNRPGLVKAALALLNFGEMDNVKNFLAVKHNRKIITFHKKDQIIHFADASLGRLPDVQNANLVELFGGGGDAHNCGIYEMDGIAKVTAAVASFYGRTLSE